MLPEAPPPRRVRHRLAAGREEPAREAVLVEPVRPVAAEQEGRLRRDVRGKTRAAADRHLLPQGHGRPAGGGVDQVVLERTRASPAAPVGAARREAAFDELDGIAPRERDRDAAAACEVSAGGDVAVAAEQRERVVDGPGLDDAVEVEPDARRNLEQTAVQADAAEAGRCGGAGRPRVRRQRGEVAVVSRGLERDAERRVDEPARLLGRCQRRSTIAANSGLTSVGRPACALATFSWLPGTNRLKMRSRRANRPRDLGGLGGGRAGDDDVASHRAEPVERGHELAVAAPGGASAGATMPAWSRFSRTIWTYFGGAASGCSGFFGWPA